MNRQCDPSGHVFNTGTGLLCQCGKYYASETPPDKIAPTARPWTGNVVPPDPVGFLRAVQKLLNENDQLKSSLARCQEENTILLFENRALSAGEMPLNWCAAHKRRNCKDCINTSVPCPDGLLPDGETCPRCGCKRGPSGIGGGTWVHISQ